MNMLELTPDREEQIQNLGKPLSLKPHISDFKFICQSCKDAGVKSRVYLKPPHSEPWEDSYWDEDGDYCAGGIRWFFRVRCTNGHMYTISKDVPIAYDVDGLINEEEDSAGEGEFNAKDYYEAQKKEHEKPKHYDISLMETVPVGDGGKKDPTETWDADVK
jgi:hypothetical protein